ncbi:MAG TPA: UDP-3-O-(3-hydroxymyristoyl)glucosamine N-acyltransferase [Myxococcaceae bacterium]|nr:UDP-3-O-(3-hydroxymyristoyl)glucosamine N-acyltransferase [Myxococcaceae bacterium]
MERSLTELAAEVGGTVEGDGRLRIVGLASLEEAGPGQLSFYGNPRYRKELGTTRASAVLLPPGEAVTRTDVAWVRVASPHLAWARLLALFHPGPRPVAGIHPRAEVHPSARVDPSATVMALAVVDASAVVGPRSVLWPGSYVGEGTQLGEDCVLQPGAVVREKCTLGDRVLLQPGAVVGSDGFGFAFDSTGLAHVKVPQVGTVRIEDDVEVGAGSCIDRATTGETVIGRGTKIDNLVQIAHNVRVGPLSIVCAQVGISGSTEVGEGVVLAGQVGIVGHVHIGDGARIAAQSGVPHDVPAGQTFSGYPAVERSLWLRQSAALKQLPELLREIRQLRARVAALESRKDGSTS